MSDTSGFSTSPEIASLIAALAKAQGECPVIKKSKTAKVRGTTEAGRQYEYTFAYADLGDIMPQIMPVLSKHQLACIQPTSIEGETIYITTRLMHASGEWIESRYPVAGYTKTSHQKIGASLTYARRYALCSLLGIVSDEDLDAPDETTAPASGDRPTREPAKPPTAKPPVADKTFLFIDRYGITREEALHEEAFVVAMLEELNESIIYDALGCVMDNNTEEASRLSEASQERINEVYQARCKTLRRTLHDETADQGEGA